PRKDDCPICFLRLPLSVSQEIHYQSCCGKSLCDGCVLYADRIARQSYEYMICPFCRAPTGGISDDEKFERIKKRIEVGDANAMRTLGFWYSRGYGYPQDSKKALELWHQAAKLGCAESHGYIADAYIHGEDVEMDLMKAKYHWELAAIGGDVQARTMLGHWEKEEGNTNRATMHFMISAGFGNDNSLEEIQNGFSDGHVTKDDFEKALRAHKEAKDEMQSDQRDAARRQIAAHAASMPRET
ncbi:hypothetical protein ACHAXR_005087, partial [Thalassiosira sp. AJA248-18]